MPTDKIAKVEGYLKGIVEDISEMKEDIKEIKNNDKNKLERITKLEEKSRSDDRRWKAHVSANKKHKDDFKEFKKQYFQETKEFFFIL